MKKHVIMGAIALMLIAAVCIAGCTSPPSSSNQTNTTNATRTTNVTTNVTTTNGTPVTAPQGQNFTITLQANPSTGYQWQPESNANLTLVSQTYVPTQPVMPGSGGSDVFTFQGLKTGTTTLAFDSVSPSGTVTNRMLYQVTITPATAGQAQTFAITLPSNPSTGYQWQPRFDASALTMKGQAYEPTQPVMPGSGGSDVFTFEVLKAGTTTITFDNVSPSGTVTQTTSVGVMVTPATGGQAQTFAITLPSNPSTGYQWQPRFDASAVTLTSRTYEPTQPVMPGSGGSDVFTFQGLRTGTTTITFDSVSPSGTVTQSIGFRLP